MSPVNFVRNGFRCLSPPNVWIRRLRRISEILVSTYFAFDLLRAVYEWGLPQILFYMSVRGNEKILSILSCGAREEAITAVAFRCIEKSTPESLRCLLRATGKKVDEALFRKTFENERLDHFSALLTQDFDLKKTVLEVPEKFFRHVVNADDPRLTYRLHNITQKVLYDVELSYKIICQFVELKKIINPDSYIKETNRHVSFIIEQKNGLRYFAEQGVYFSEFLDGARTLESFPLEGPCKTLELPLLLHIAAVEGNINLARKLLDEGAARNERSLLFGFLLPHELAALHNRVEMVGLLLDGSVTSNSSLGVFSNFLATCLKESNFEVFMKVVKSGVPPPLELDYYDVITEKLVKGSTPAFVEFLTCVVPVMMRQCCDQVQEGGRLEDSKLLLLMLELVGLKHFDINTQISNGDTLLHVAVRRQEVSVVERVIRAGADPSMKNSEGKSALCIAVGTGNTNLLEAFIRGGLDLTPHAEELFTASVVSKNAQIIRWLFLQGCATPSEASLVRGMIGVLLEDKTIEWTKEVELLKKLFLLAQKVQLVEPYLPTLYSLLTQEPLLQILKKEEMLNSAVSSNRETLLHYAACFKDTIGLQALIAHGSAVDPQTAVTKSTPLHYAVSTRYLDGVRILLEHPQTYRHRAIRINFRTGSTVEQTPYETALYLGDTSVLELFLTSKVPPFDLILPMIEAMRNLGQSDKDVKDVKYNSYLFSRLRKLLLKHELLVANMNKVRLACQDFNKTGLIAPEMLKALASHLHYIPFIQKIGYQELFGTEVCDVLCKALVPSSRTQLADYVKSVLNTLEGNSLEEKEAELRDALLAVNGILKALLRMNAISKVSEYIPYQDLKDASSRIGQLLQRHRSIQLQAKQTFREEFDEKDGMIVVGWVFSDRGSTKVTELCRRASKIGLAEGRDFRVVGIDDNISGICETIQEQGAYQKLTEEVGRKRTLVQRFQERGLLQEILLIQETETAEASRSWELHLNKALLDWVLSQEEKIQVLLQGEEAESLSQIKKVDVVDSLLSSFGSG